MNKIYCVYHKNCLDGMASATVVERWSEENCEVPYEFIRVPMDYGDELPEAEEGSLLFVVDFSISVEQIIIMESKAIGVRMFDHHISSINKYNGDCLLYDYSPGFTTEVILDTTRSGCQITWDTLYPNLPRPPYVKYIGDRDLWLFEHENTESYCRALVCGIDRPKVWDQLLSLTEESLVESGTSLLADDATKISWHLQNTVRMASVEPGLNIMFCNVPRYLTSEHNNTLLKSLSTKPNKLVRTDIVASYYDTKDHRVIRFNSLKGGPDVSEIAERLGGGGHVNSASVKVPRTHLLAKL